MFFETVLETNDKSWFADRLVEITGKSREYWSDLSLAVLRNILEKEIREKRGERPWKGKKGY